MELTFYIANENVQRVVDAVNGLYPIPPELVGELTPGQWTKEWIRCSIVRIVRRYEQRQAAQAAVVDDGIVVLLTSTPLPPLVRGETPAKRGTE